VGGEDEGHRPAAIEHRRGGGKETGQKMQHYVIPGGPFADAYAALAATGWKLNLESAHRPGEQRGPSSKTKFTCPMCGWNVWGKPDTAVLCLPCFEDCTADGHIEFARHALMLPAKDVARADALISWYERENAYD